MPGSKVCGSSRKRVQLEEDGRVQAHPSACRRETGVDAVPLLSAEDLCRVPVEQLGVGLVGASTRDVDGAAGEALVLAAVVEVVEGVEGAVLFSPALVPVDGCNEALGLALTYDPSPAPRAAGG